MSDEGYCLAFGDCEADVFQHVAAFVVIEGDVAQLYLLFEAIQRFRVGLLLYGVLCFEDIIPEQTLSAISSNSRFDKFSTSENL